jgi:PAS domain S-box-containing protein
VNDREKTRDELIEELQALRESHEQLRLALEVASDGFRDWNVQTGEVFFSPRWLATLGYEPGELEPHVDSWKRLVHPDDMPRVTEALQAHFEGKTPIYECQNRLRTKNGSYRWNLDRGQVVSRDASGKPLRMVGVDADITSRKDAEEALHQSREKYRLLFNHMLDGFALESASVGIHLVDLEGKVEDCNAALERMLGYTKEELATMLFTEFTHPEDAEKDTALFKELVAGERTHYLIQKRHVRKDGHTIWARVNASLVRGDDGKPEYAIRLVEDITEQKRAEDALRRLNVELEDRVFKRTAELVALNKELEAFSYSVSHDLRAPVRHVTGFVKLLDEHAGANMDETSRRHLTIIAESARKMGQLIDALLEFSRTARKELKTTTVDMKGLVREVQQECLGGVDGRQIAWKVHPLPEVAGDRALLRAALVNLISNALKFTAGRTRAEIEIGTGAPEDGAALIFIRDNGVGFDERYASKIFGVFQRLHDAAEFEGTGIGLANVKRIIDRHGGRVWAEGALDRGATFYFWLPKPKGGSR